MQPRHWHQLFEHAGIKALYHSDNQLKELIALDVFKYQAIIEMVTTTAVGESDVETSYKTIESKWKEVLLPIVKGQQKTDDSLLIVDTAELVTYIKKTTKTS